MNGSLICVGPLAVNKQVDPTIPFFRQPDEKLANLTSVHSCRPPLEDPSSVNCQNSCSLGPFIKDVGKFYAILTPPSSRRQFFTAVRWQI